MVTCVGYKDGGQSKVERTVANRTWARQPGLLNGKCETRNRNSMFPTVI